MSIDNSESNIIRKIQALMAMANRMENEEAAMNYFEKAQALLVKHAIDEAALTPEEKAQFIKKTVSLTPNQADNALLNAICSHNSVRFVRSMHRIKGKENKQRYGWLFGTEADIAFCEGLYTSLLLFRETQLSKAHKPEWEHGKSFKASFRLAYAGRISKRLDEWHKTVMESEGSGTDLVLYDKNKAVADFVTAEIGKTVQLRGPSMNSRAGVEAGARAGNRADISGGRRNVGGSRTALTG